MKWTIQIIINCTNGPVFAQFINFLVCLTTGPKPLPKPALHIVRSRASSFKWEYPLLSLRSFSSFLRLLPRPPVSSIPPFIIPSITRCRRQFLHKMWPMQLAFRLLICSILHLNLFQASLHQIKHSNLKMHIYYGLATYFGPYLGHHRILYKNFKNKCKGVKKT